MKSGKCCLFSSLVIIIGLGIGGYIFREKIIHEYNKYWNSYTSSIDEDTATNIYESSEEIEDTTTRKLITTSTLSSTTEEYYSYPDPEPDLKVSEEEGDFTTINSTTETPTTTSSTTVPLTTTFTTERTSSTTSIFEGSGSNHIISQYRRPSDYDDDEDEYEDDIEGSGA